MKSTPKDYRKGNLEASRIILETPEVYGPGMVEWARRVRGEWVEKPQVEEISCNCVSDVIMSKPSTVLPNPGHPAIGLTP